MKKQKKQLIITLIILVICIAALIGVKLYNKYSADDEASTSSSTDVYTVDSSDVTAFSYMDADSNTIAYHLDGDSWIYDGDETLDLDEDTVSGMLAYFETVSATNTIKDGDASEYGFDSPSNIITVTSNGETTKLTYGMYNEMTEEYYLIINDDTSKIYVTSGNLLKIADSAPTDLVVTSTDDATSTDTTSTDTTEE